MPRYITHIITVIYLMLGHPPVHEARAQRLVAPHAVLILWHSFILATSKHGMGLDGQSLFKQAVFKVRPAHYITLHRWWSVRL